MRSVGLSTDAATGISALNVLSGLSDVVVCVLLQTRTEKDAKRMHELESRIQAENSRNKTLNDELSTLKVWIHVS